MACNARSWFRDRLDRYPKYGLIVLLTMVCSSLRTSAQDAPPAKTLTAIERAKSDVQTLTVAALAYRTEYNRLPLQTIHTDEKQPLTSEGKLMELLLGLDLRLNPRQVIFFEGTTQADGKLNKGTSTSAPDPWGQVYRLHFDWNSDRKIEDPRQAGNPITAVVLVYSAGPDGDFSTWADNITSWK